jgi:hypothetical protein
MAVRCLSDGSQMACRWLRQTQLFLNRLQKEVFCEYLLRELDEIKKRDSLPFKKTLPEVCFIIIRKFT